MTDRRYCSCSMRPGCFWMTRCSPDASASGSRRCARRTCQWCSLRSHWPTFSVPASRRRWSRVAPAAFSCPIIARGAAVAHRLRGLWLERSPDQDHRARRTQARLLLPVRLGNRLFDLGLGPLALALCGSSSPDDQRLIDRCLAGGEPTGFAARFLDAKGLAWASAVDRALAAAGNAATDPTIHYPHRSGRRSVVGNCHPAAARRPPSPKAAAPADEARATPRRCLASPADRPCRSGSLPSAFRQSNRKGAPDENPA